MGENLFLEMKNYSFFFKDERFEIDIIPKSDEPLYELKNDHNTLYILVPLAGIESDRLKVYYPLQAYQASLKEIRVKLIWFFITLSFIAAIISLLFAFYALKPIRKSLALLEEFIKDIIHDLNTPITSILINLKMIDTKTEEIESIEQSAHTISMLHKNLDTYLRQTKAESEKFALSTALEHQIKFFESMYGYLKWEVSIEDKVLYTDKQAFTRIVYNLLSNACKYNTSNGMLKVVAKQNFLTIINDSYGIKNPNRLFERFYKENDRGVGIGLHIVEKLCKELKIEKSLEVEGNKVIISLDLNQVLEKSN